MSKYLLNLKRDKIINAALEGFSSQGISATTTKSIAASAGVSEALIFKHFTNKDGLVEAILEIAKKRGEALVKNWNESEHPKIKIKTIIKSALLIDNQDLKLILFIIQFKNMSLLTGWEFALKFNDDLLKVFRQLGHSDPETECKVFWMQMYGIIDFKQRGWISNNIALYDKISDKFEV